MTAKTFLLITAATFGLSAAPLSAQNAEIDVNGDGMYSYPELLVVLPDMTEDEFTVLDASGDGLLDADEIAAGTEAGLLPAMDG